ncbi:Aldo/keto reductase [Linnemannia elongata AG-77]|uniref:Aldo/keto reductase n=1 Tax=Linnemannia elongata AG-77 TaxID=1314771 RepID=A0A197JUC3_9FUNG|nr:Aldo/keto reductase [Linnemannia elongata AG-77]
MANTTTANIPRVVLGTMTFGLEKPDAPDSFSMVRVRGAQNVAPFLTLFHSHSHTELDTALVYGDGDTEKVLAQALPTIPHAAPHFNISTKVPPFVMEDKKQRGHTKENLGKQFRESLKSLEVERVDILYLHAPDHETPFEETLKAVDELYREGLFERFGLSNYSSWNVALIYELCKQNGYVLPTVYQGNYNPIGRSVVPELLPCLKHFNIGFYAYNPICGGVLSGKYKFDGDVPEGSRYDPKTRIGPMVRGMYWNKTNFEAIETLKAAAARTHNITLLEATLRWMRHHSGLDARDGIIMGASTVDQLNETLTALEQGPLGEEMVSAFDDAWEHVKGITEWYFHDPQPEAVKEE